MIDTIKMVISMAHGNTNINGSYVNRVYCKAIVCPIIYPTISPIMLLDSTKTNDSKM